jgi:hypothetical protein
MAQSCSSGGHTRITSESDSSCMCEGDPQFLTAVHPVIDIAMSSVGSLPI